MDNIQNAFNLASDLDKQIISLSTGLLAVSITFIKEIVKTTPKVWMQNFLYVSWFFYLLAVCVGLLTMGKLTSASLELQPIAGKESLDAAMPFALIQESFFLLGVVCTIFYGIAVAVGIRQNRSG
jgi:hypothetical protein